MWNLHFRVRSDRLCTTPQIDALRIHSVFSPLDGFRCWFPSHMGELVELIMQWMALRMTLRTPSIQYQDPGSCFGLDLSVQGDIP